MLIFGYLGIGLLHGGSRHIEIGEVGNTHFNTYIEEDGHHTHHIVGEAESLLQRRFVGFLALNLLFFEQRFGQFRRHKH